MRQDPKASILYGVFLWRIGFVSGLIGGATIAVFLIELRYFAAIEDRLRCFSHRLSR